MESTEKREPNLYLYEDELDERPHIADFISSLANYENTIPAATDPDAKPPPPSARMGKFQAKDLKEYIIDYAHSLCKCCVSQKSSAKDL